MASFMPYTADGKLIIGEAPAGYVMWIFYDNEFVNHPSVKKLKEEERINRIIQRMNRSR